MHTVNSSAHQQAASFTAFRAPWWLRNGHAQTLYAGLWPRPAPALRRERLELPDGDFVDLAWTDGSAGSVVIVLHGLEGSVDSNYARGLLARLHRDGRRGVLMHFRGCGGEPNRLARRYHSGDTGDLNYLVDVLLRREPGTLLCAVGVSLGGNVLLKWLAERRPNPLAAAVAVSVPFDLDKSVRRLSRGFSRMYQRRLLRSLQRSMVRHAPALDALSVSTDQIAACRTLRDFDDLITAPLHGFDGAGDYYHRCSSGRTLGQIETPTLIIHSQDDPFVDPASIPKRGQHSAQVELAISPNGGHVGFVAGTPWRPQFWLDDAVSAFFDKQLGCGAPKHHPHIS